MPDWSYHPFFKPLLFRLRAEDARALTLKLLEIQSKTALGRAIFRLLAPGAPPPSLKVEAFGLSFPSPVGLAPGIDVEASATSVLQELGFGFLVVGPAGHRASSHEALHHPLRVEDRHSIIESGARASRSTHEISKRIADTPDLRVPIGVALAGDDLPAAIAQCERASFFTLPSTDDGAALKRVRGATSKPLLVRLPAGLDDALLDRMVDAAIDAGIDGGVAIVGAPCAVVPEGSIDGPFLFEEARRTIARLHAKYGDRFPLVGAGGVFQPEDACVLLDAGAKLVELHAGLVYAGPGLPGRILQRLERPPKDAISPREEPAATVRETNLIDLARGSTLLFITGLVLLVSGVTALVLAATVKLLPNDVRYLGMTMDDLCGKHACRIVHFMAHDRVSWGGSMLAISLVYLWLAWVPIRRREAWAWWTLAISGAIGFASFLTYLGFGYLDKWHASATCALLPVFLAGLFFSFRAMAGRPRGISSLTNAVRTAYRWSPAGMGRLLVAFAAFGMIAGGLTIMYVGMTRVFVSTDLQYMQVTRESIASINPRLVSLIAHDRAGFGGGLASGGVAVMLTLFCGARPGARGLWWALLGSGSVGFATAIGIHPIVGYTSFLHLLPAYAGALAFLVGMLVLRRPLCHERGERFSDF